VKGIFSILFIFLFTLQVSVKSLVSLYFNSIAQTEASDHCMYKTLTVCKGSCYVVEKIKVFSSQASQETPAVPGFDLNSFKDALCDYPVTHSFQFAKKMFLTSINDSFDSLYHYLPFTFLLRPPIF